MLHHVMTCRVSLHTYSSCLALSFSGQLLGNYLLESEVKDREEAQAFEAEQQEERLQMDTAK